MAYSTIPKPSLYFNTKLYAGNNGTNAITGVGFQPDFNWIKDRTSTGEHLLVDAVRGMYNIRSNSTAAQSANGTIHQQSLDSDGFTVAGSAGNSNASGRNYASWNWKANGAGSANTDGTTNSTVSVNTTAGFSIVKYAGADAVRTVGHGLGVKPNLILVKRLGSTGNWQVYHSSLGATKYLALNENSAVATSTARWNDTEPTSSVFSLSTSAYVNESGDYIAYCFAEKKGYSKFGSYTGIGNADGPFIYTGFKPAFIMFKRTGAAAAWYIKDNKRSGTAAGQNFGQMNPNQLQYPSADATFAENKASGYSMDILSNGFKPRGTDSGMNTSGGNYIYMAFAEEPLVANSGTDGVPATAR